MPKTTAVSKETQRRSATGTSLFKSLRSSRQVPSSVQVAAAPHKGEGNNSNKKTMGESGTTDGENDRPTDPKEAPTNKNDNDETKLQKMTGKLKKRLGVVREDQAEEFYVDDSEEEDHDSTNNGMDDEEQQPPAASAASQKGRRRRSAISLLHNAFGASNIRLRTEMDLIREKFADTFRREGNAVLLHGYLHIQIIRARNLRNADCFRGFHELCKCISTDVSDPYVTVHAGAHRLVKTPQIQDDLNPEWKLDFFVPVGHVMEGLEFRVKDRDEVGSELLGTTYLSVHELIRFPGHDNLDSSNNGVSLSLSHDFGQGSGSDSNSVELLRTGVHKTVHLDNKPHHGSLEYFVEFIPKDMLHKVPRNRGLLTPKSRVSMVVPGVYFPLRQNNRLRLYINADDKGEVMGTPRVRYGTDNDEKLWKPRRFFRDVYDSICRAEHMVYIVGWSVDYTQSLLRGIEQTQGLNVSEDGTKYSPYIGELLNQKANEGVVVNMLVWDDQTSNAIKRVGVVATMDEQLRDYFRGSKVNLRLVPMVGGNTNILKKFRNAVYYTHHQKCVICDTPKKELVAYVGGVDLTYGRYDDGSYPLFRTLNTDHKSDFHNACAEVNPALGPRQPWHDIHSRVEGLGALDLLQNFEERWIGQGGLASDLVRLEDKGIKGQAHSVEEDEDAWNTQLFRSIDERTAKLKSPQFAATSFDEIKGVEFAEGKEIKGGKRRSMLEHILKTGKEREQHFIASADSEHGGEGDTLEVARPLDIKRELRVDSSCHKALIHHIRNAQHSIYMESQYFLSSSYLWPEGKTDKCCNMVAAEITFKICEKIEAGERFAAYIVVPMWPEGLPDSSSVQDILAYQSYTMKAMYKRIAKSIERRRNKLVANGNHQQVNDFEDVKPTDYLNFYCLANRETAEGTEKLSANELLNRTRRHLVYTHSKMTIVDDSIILIGSANINQRSLDGNRDSELLMGAWQPAHLATNDSVPNGDVHGFRMHCFAHLTGIMEDVFRKPSSLECVRRLNAIAADSWKMYTQDQVCDMTSHIVPYPIKVFPNGNLEPATADGRFPDTNARILGTPGSLPKFLTT